MMSDAGSASGVTLIVKAPNQQIEDQTVQCELGWTVRRLKGHLAEVYPNRPRTEEQRLIYSGHLLNDASTLGQILRTADGQTQHTLHLVCTQHPYSYSQTPVSTPNVPSSSPDGLRPDGLRPDGVRRRTVDTSASQSSSESAPRDSSSSSSLHSTSSSTSTSTSTSSSSFDVRQIGSAFFPGAFLPPPPNLPVSPSPSVDSPLDQVPDLHNMQTQYMAWMQQAYAQYMMQYMQFMVANGGQTAGLEWSNMANVGAGPAAAAASGAADSDRQAPPNGGLAHREGAAAARQGQGLGQEDNVVNDDDLANRRDWLEWMYFMFRLVVLFMLVYAYSSPLRFAIVSILGICVYLYQRGFFRSPFPAPDPYIGVMRVPDNNNEPNVVDAAEEAGARQQNAEDAAVADAAAAPANPAAAAAPANAASPAANPATAAAAAAAASGPIPVAEPPRPSLLALTWAFFTCFITSIIPERPVIP